MNVSHGSGDRVLVFNKTSLSHVHAKESILYFIVICVMHKQVRSFYMARDYSIQFFVYQNRFSCVQT